MLDELPDLSTYGLPALPGPSAALAPPEPEQPGMARLAPSHLQPQGALPPSPPGGGTAPTAAEPPPSAPRLATGLSLLAAAVAGVAGYVVSGNGWGAGAGVLYYGAGRNAWRTCALLGRDNTEATKSGTVALFGLVGAGYLTYRSLDRGAQE